jgi:hypothetical protein
MQDDVASDPVRRLSFPQKAGKGIDSHKEIMGGGGGLRV